MLSHWVMSNSLWPYRLVCQASLSMGTLQARILEWVTMPSSKGSSWLRDWTPVSHTAGGFFTVWATTRPFYSRSFPGGSDGKESTCNVGDLGSIPGLGRSLGGGHGNPLQYSCLENPLVERSLVYSSWVIKESDVSEWPSTHRVETKKQETFHCHSPFNSKEDRTVSLLLTEILTWC